MWRRAHMTVARCLQGEKSLAELSLMRRAILPKCPPCAPQRRQALLVANRILDDDGLDLFGVGNCHPQSNRAAVIMEEKAVSAQFQRVGEVLHHLSQIVERVAELFRTRPGRVAEARVVWGDQAVFSAEPRLQHRLIHSRRRW